MGKFLVLDHLILDGNQGSLHGVGVRPITEERELVGLNSPIGLVHKGEVHLRNEIHLRGSLGVVRSALDVQEVDSVVEVGVGRAYDGSIPVSEALVVSYSH